jgi:hypothetical protein
VSLNIISNFVLIEDKLEKELKNALMQEVIP